MTRSGDSTLRPASREATSEPRSTPPADAPDPLALDPLSPIAAPDHRWFLPAHRPV
jgi:hypothetical protein